MRVNIDCTLILLLLSGMLALLKIGGQFPKQGVLRRILIIAWIIGVIGVLTISVSSNLMTHVQKRISCCISR